ncbi:MAG: hypothetical protein F6J96_09305 [Symploca sp. SIO1C2]|nr:hypothetical protein [Symploca sp. SIO1C2]
MIQLFYGNQQQFRFRHNDINILGQSDTKLPVKRSVYRLNNGLAVHFYVEPEPEPGESKYPWGAHTPSVLRLNGRRGHFNIEIPINCPELQAGGNNLSIEIEDMSGKVEMLDAEFQWNPQPLPLPLSLSDLSVYQSIQEIGQVLNGAFDIDYDKNVIRSRIPVVSDSLLLLGSPYGSQEATYDVKFTSKKGIFIGLSDFFAGFEEQSPGLGIKPGYSTAGLATIKPSGWAHAWIAKGDALMDKDWTWVLSTEFPKQIAIQEGVTYSVRHQVIIAEGVNCVRYRIWPKGDLEPNQWLCDENNAYLNGNISRITKASFGLFQHEGEPTEWSNINVKPLEVNVRSLGLRQKNYRRKLQKTVRGIKSKLLNK